MNTDREVPGHHGGGLRQPRRRLGDELLEGGVPWHQDREMKALKEKFHNIQEEKKLKLVFVSSPSIYAGAKDRREIGRASCRERV